MIRVASSWLVVAVLLFAGTAWGEAIGPFETRFETDWATAGISGLRGQGTGDITLAGITGTVTKAYLYWHGPLDEGQSNANVTLNAAPVVGTDLGASSDNCWNFDQSKAYRADVTSLVSGDGVYSIAAPVSVNKEINGATLVVFFDDANGSNNRDVVLFDGNDSNIDNPFDDPGWHATLAGINYSGGTAAAFFVVSDGQDFSDNGLEINGTELLPQGDNNFQGDTLPDAGGGSPNNDGNLWDHRNFDITSLLSLGPNSLSVNSLDPTGDCLSLVTLAIDLPAGAAPPVPEPGSIAVALSGLATLAIAGLKRRHQFKLIN